MHLASAEGQILTVQFLLNVGAKIVINKENQSALTISILKRNVNVVNTFIKVRKNYTSKDILQRYSV